LIRLPLKTTLYWAQTLTRVSQGAGKGIIFTRTKAHGATRNGRNIIPGARPHNARLFVEKLDMPKRGRLLHTRILTGRLYQIGGR